MQKWKKLGLIFAPDGSEELMHSHASVPFVSEIQDDVVTIFFSSRDRNQVSSIFSLDYDLVSKRISSLQKDPLLSAGDIGTFDDSGVMGCCILEDDNGYKLYYIGWNLGVTVPFRNSVGLAVSKDNKTFSRAFPGPVLDRNRNEPHFCASSCVMKENGVYKIWYLSCTGWEKDQKGSLVHRYHIKYAESDDGIDWKREGAVAIDFCDRFEYAISVPRVVKDGGIYKMWFSSRATKDTESYRIRYAESFDGIDWVRKDNEVGIDVSESGWDSEMICYPYVFDFEGDHYMLYNGNGYGKTGFGLAVWEQ
jgi:hypothetical protein